MITLTKFKSMARVGLIWLFGALIGSGAIWKYLDNRRAQDAFELEESKSIKQLSDQLVEVLQKAIELSKEYVLLQGSHGSSNDPQYMGKVAEVRLRLDTYRSAYYAIETQLAKLEHRETRDWVDFLPPTRVNDLH